MRLLMMLNVQIVFVTPAHSHAWHCGTKKHQTLRLAIGARYTIRKWLVVYAGPFWHYIDGEKHYTERAPVPGYEEKFDVEARSNWGGFIGAEASLSEVIRLAADLQLTAHDWIIGLSCRCLW